MVLSGDCASNKLSRNLLARLMRSNFPKTREAAASGVVLDARIAGVMDGGD